MTDYQYSYKLIIGLYLFSRQLPQYNSSNIIKVDYILSSCDKPELAFVLKLFVSYKSLIFLFSRGEALNYYCQQDYSQLTAFH